MSGASITAEFVGLAQVRARLQQLTPHDFAELAESIGAVVESQTRRRIQEEKTGPDGPDGAAWEPWSPRTAKARHAGQTLLQYEGDLLDSIQYQAAKNEVEVGTNLVYGAAHQFGAHFSIVSNHAEVDIPARPFLGLSTENEKDLTDLVSDFLQRVVGVTG